MHPDQTWRTWCARAAATIAVLLVATFASAQSGSIAGVVKDSSGAVLPGVTVEASSPALIEKVRAVVTDGSGQYKIIDLPVGVYRVTFSLPGFANLQREGIELTTGFTAPANAEMRPGGLEETITVSGSSPVVDVQNVVVAQSMNRETMNSLPTGGYYQNFAVLIPGMVQATTGASNFDVGGTSGNAKQRGAIHGGLGNDAQALMNGMNIGSTHIGSGERSFLTVPDGDIEEVTLAYSSNAAEVESGGVQTNIVPRTGGNVYRGSGWFNYGSESLQSKNVDAGLKAKGVADNQGIQIATLMGTSFGGPIKQDKLWFFTDYQWNKRVAYVNTFYPLNPTGFTYQPDMTKQGVSDQIGPGSAVGRLTYQLNAKNKVSGSFMWNNWCECHFGISATNTPQSDIRSEQPGELTQLAWTSPLTNRLLFEAGFSAYRMLLSRALQTDPQALGPTVVDENGFRMRDSAASGSTAGPHSDVEMHNTSFRGAMSYVTGAHAFRVGGIFQPISNGLYAYSHDPVRNPNGVNYEITTLRGLPSRVTYIPMPITLTVWGDKVGLFAQDQWTHKRLTANYGVRYDWMKTGYLDGVAAPELQGFKALKYPAGTVLNWKDLSPRLGVAYDVGGDGKTAIKLALGRYVNQEALNLTQLVTPAWALTPPLTRTWNDFTACAGCISGDWIPQGDPLNPAANGEIGVSPDARYGDGTLRPQLSLDPDFAVGYGVRPYNWEMSAGIQRELAARVSVNASYFRRIFGNSLVTDNVAVSPSSYDSFCVNTPLDARLPDGGGKRLCGFTDVKVAGGTQNVNKSTSQFGKAIQHWNGMDLTTNVRLESVLLQGGLSTGKTVTDDCDIRNKYFDEVTALTTGSTLFCHTETPFLTQVKFSGSYTIPWQSIQISAAFQNQPGTEIAANYTATNAVIDVLPVDRNLSAGATATRSINMIKPGTLYRERVSQMDMRFGKDVKMGGGRSLSAMIGLYNAFNANTVVGSNNSYGTTGASWLVPQEILQGRLVKFELRLDY